MIGPLTPWGEAAQRLQALADAYAPGNYALADGVCHVYHEGPIAVDLPVRTLRSDLMAALERASPSYIVTPSTGIIEPAWRDGDRIRYQRLMGLARAAAEAYALEVGEGGPDGFVAQIRGLYTFTTACIHGTPYEECAACNPFASPTVVASV